MGKAQRQEVINGGVEAVMEGQRSEAGPRLKLRKRSSCDFASLPFLEWIKELSHTGSLKVGKFVVVSV